MLVLSRQFGQRVLVRDEVTGVKVWVTVVTFDGKNVKLGFEGPESVKFLREEIIDVPKKGA